jgi:NAD(P)-dependent dehydrogenase (short-subunit alcohol dehydrogenase family)
VSKKLQGKIALVTGASRGIGASTARQLAEAGADIVINYRSKAPRAEEVAQIVRDRGQRAVLAQADLTQENETQKMIELAREQFGRLDLLILNASGGLEKDRDKDYAVELNVTAQTRVVRLALPILATGARIVFVTSHLAHFYGQIPSLSDYEPVAASKRAGEDALRAQIPELCSRGISLVVVSGDLIEGTITAKLLNRSQRGLIEERRAEAGSLPTVDEFAAAIVAAASDAAMKSGDTLYIGDTTHGNVTPIMPTGS